MKLQNSTQVKEFEKVVAECEGYVSIVNPMNGREYDLKRQNDFNLAVEAMLSDDDEQLELFSSQRADSVRMLGFIKHLRYTQKYAA